MNLTNVNAAMEKDDDMIDVTPDEQEAKKPEKWESLPKRIISSGILTACFILINFIGGYLFDLAVIATCVLIIFEWNKVQDSISRKIRIAGFLYAGTFAAGAIWLRHYSEFSGYPESSLALFYLILVVAANDVGAYFGGKSFGGPKLLPSVSPNKTISGAACGMLFGCFAGLILKLAFSLQLSIAGALIINILICIAAQTGDLLASKVKRDAGIKDFGDIIPGHGGVIDRVDGLVFAMPVFVIILFFV